MLRNPLSRRGRVSVDEPLKIRVLGDRRLMGGYQPAGPFAGAGHASQFGTESSVMDSQMETTAEGSVGVRGEPSKHRRSELAEQDAQHAVRQPNPSRELWRARLGNVVEQGSGDQVAVGLAIRE